MSSPKSICILTQTHLCRNPRVLKEAYTLSKVGYTVSVLTTFYDDGLYEEDLQLIKNTNIQYRGDADLRKNAKNSLKKVYLKAWRKTGVWLSKHNIKESVLALGYGPQSLYNMALSQKADLYICHQEMASYVGTKLLSKGKRVAFDLEDWYSEDLLPEARSNRPIRLLKKIESIALAKSQGAWTTSNAMAGAMANAYQAPAPAVIYNAFPKTERAKELVYKDRIDLSKVSLFWFSQTIGPGRGLEMLMSALKEIDLPFGLHLRGNVNKKYKETLLAQFPDRPDQTLHFHSLVSNEELPRRIAEHDIGLALEGKEPASRNYTITNKILQYLEGGLAVIASATSGQIEVAEKIPEAVFLIDQENNLSANIRQLITNKGVLASAKCQARQGFLANFTWEKEAEKLCQLVDTALGK